MSYVTFQGNVEIGSYEKWSRHTSFQIV
jgi:hypothetical protein